MINKLTVIIPVHMVDDTIKDYLKTAVESVRSQGDYTILIVGPDSLSQEINEQYAHDSKTLFALNSGETDFCSQINVGVNEIHTDYFTILELDDTFKPYFFNVAKEYVESDEYKDFMGYLPIVSLSKDGIKPLHYTNEAVWAQDFSETLGVLDFKSTKEYDVFILSGAVLRTEDYKEIGGLKGDIKLYFTKEFLLRGINLNKRFMVIPKVGYTHLVGREGALFQTYKDGGISPDEVTYYLDVAKKEYLYNPNEIKRNIEYSPSTDI